MATSSLCIGIYCMYSGTECIVQRLLMATELVRQDLIVGEGRHHRRPLSFLELPLSITIAMVYISRSALHYEKVSVLCFDRCFQQQW